MTLLSGSDDELVCLTLGFIYPNELRSVACVNRKFLCCAKTAIRNRAIQRLASKGQGDISIGFYDGYGYDLTEGLKHWRSFRVPIAIWMRKSDVCTIKHIDSQIKVEITAAINRIEVKWIKGRAMQATVVLDNKRLVHANERTRLIW
ncbi:uncharacterized protein ACA1_370780 [Acanthamoeba castellanii str. Neff]|uniref:Uncharacterized protein n=1 Tax=Acanthamoeba castellanii (strain ATCC 30010 / Neff) TaxID=1257118 RepID=L8GYD1_ACACF|nr:uncharacterized protein ACA1_370780 [Acanthamoeba castellanii str. Neff]ELR18284.1 hypothetical protein ACA1_370780 [Acanthamoeba castellanii str. Neff]